MHLKVYVSGVYKKSALMAARKCNSSIKKYTHGAPSHTWRPRQVLASCKRFHQQASNQFFTFQLSNPIILTPARPLRSGPSPHPTPAQHGSRLLAHIEFFTGPVPWPWPCKSQVRRENRFVVSAMAWSGRYVHGARNRQEQEQTEFREGGAN